jgi:hypothetical protein
MLHQLQIDQLINGKWYLAWPDGSAFDGQVYKRAQDAKRARTLLLKK